MASTFSRRRTLLQLLHIDVPIIAAPMAGANDSKMAIAVAKAGGLGSLPCAAWSLDKCYDEILSVKSALGDGKKVNVNFFCHDPPDEFAFSACGDKARWKQKVERLACEVGQDVISAGGFPKRGAFDEAACQLIEELHPGVVSFHFGLPKPELLARVKRSGAVVMASATTVAESKKLRDEGCDVVIAQGFEAGGHRSNFLGDPNDVSMQIGTIALVPQIVDAVPDLYVVAAGGVSDGRGIAAAVCLGAHAVQLGSVYLRARESLLPDYHKKALDNAVSDSTALTNVFSGRPARSITNKATHLLGPIDPKAPPFPTAPVYLSQIKAAATRKDCLAETSSLWSGQAAPLAPKTDDALSATEITKSILRQAEDIRLCISSTGVLSLPY